MVITSYIKYNHNLLNSYNQYQNSNHFEHQTLFLLGIQV